MSVIQVTSKTGVVARIQTAPKKVFRIDGSLRGPVGPRGQQGIQGEVGPQGPIGETGPQGDPGDGAYTNWLNEGNVGTEAEFLATLVGPQGPQGIQGDTGATGATGPKGDKGDTGDTGPAGDDGDSAYEVAVAGGFVGTEAEWLDSLVGPQGPQGETGPQGPSGSGTGDMVAATYDPTGKNSDAFSMDNMVETATKKVLTSAERTKLSGIETGATADQTGAEIKTLYEAEADTNAFTDTEKTKLAGVEAGAQVNEVTQSELDTGLAGKSNVGHGHTASDISDFDAEVGNQADVAANTAARHTHANAAVLNATTASFTTADETKLDGIEAGADVTDAANVAAAGAFMDADVIDEDDMASDSATKVPTQQSVKAYTDTKTLPFSNETVNQNSTLLAFGDSITSGTGATTSSDRWANIFAASKGFTLTNNGLSGARSNDPAVMDAIYGTTIATTTNSTLMIGVNNARVNGSSLAYADTFRACVLAEALWLAIPDAYKYRVNQLSTTGTWSSNSNIPLAGSTNGYSTTTSGATVTATVNGTAVYIATDATTSSTATFNVTIDGYDYGTFDMATHQSLNTRQGTGGAWSAYGLRFAGLAPGAHTVVITTLSTQAVYIDWIAGNGFPRAKTGPNVWLSNITRASSAYYSANSPHSEAAVRLHNTMLADIAQLLAYDGLQVTFVNALGSINNSTDLSDGLHPNNTGHTKIANEFIAASSSFVKQGDRGAGLSRSMGWTEFTLLNSWVTFSTAFPSTAFTRSQDGVVRLRGVVKGGTIGTGTTETIAYLPEGFRPMQQTFLSTVSNGAQGIILINPDGRIRPYAGNNAYISLDGLSFMSAH